VAVGVSVVNPERGAHHATPFQFFKIFCFALRLAVGNAVSKEPEKFSVAHVFTRGNSRWFMAGARGDPSAAQDRLLEQFGNHGIPLDG